MCESNFNYKKQFVWYSIVIVAAKLNAKHDAIETTEFKNNLIGPENV